MSNRSLIEINHDFGFKIEDAPARFVEALGAYLASASRENAEELEHYGVRVIGMRHHSGNFILDGEPEGFPVSHLPRAHNARIVGGESGTSTRVAQDDVPVSPTSPRD